MVLAGGSPSPLLPRLTRWFKIVHIAFAWPLPALVGIHLLVRHYF